MLEKIAQEYDVILNNDVSFPMQFELLVNQILSKRKSPGDSIYAEIKEKISEPLINARLPLPSPHKALTDSADCLLTTNYDFLLEQSLDAAFDVASYPFYIRGGNNKYNLNNPYRVNGKEVFHIHGDAHRAQSICLGYEHYAGTLQYLRTSISQKKKDEKIAAIVRILKESPKGGDSGSSVGTSWAEKFFTDNVHIIGLGLSESEIDLWWLITYRAFLYYSDRFGAKSLIRNTIVYHDIGLKPNEKIRYMLTNNAVEYRFHKINSLDDISFFEEYRKIADSIKTSSLYR